MNWEEISKKHPEALNELVKWSSLRESKHQETWLSPYRALYDFFDEWKIFGWVSPEIQYTRIIDEDDKNPHYCIDEWGYDIHDDEFELAMDCKFKTRTEAEEAAFEKAFEILEEKLK